jgi:Malectin domain
MSAATSVELEQEEVRRILEDGVLAKSPRLAKFFCFICERYFAGRSEEIKEYSIALEALGRPSDFDPKKDSIVRVEAHRLRKRLEEYYKGPGAGHVLHVVIPSGQYRPQFVLREAANTEARRPEGEVPATTAVIPLEPVANGLNQAPSKEYEAEGVGPEAESKPGRARFWLAVLGAALVVGLVGGLVWQRVVHKTAAGQREEVWKGSSADPVSGEFRMLAGYHGPAFGDRQGHTWVPDAYYTGGVSSPVPPEHFIEGQPDPHLIKAQRLGRFRYDIPLRAGNYELHLYFAEVQFGRGNPGGGGDSSRTFPVAINGETRISLLDPLADAGAPNRLDERVFKDVGPAADGKLHLEFAPAGGPALLNAIEILPTMPGRIHPVRIVAQANPVTDSDGRVWAADEYFFGGNFVARRKLVANSPEKVLYAGERYGNFSYRIPLAPGKYRVSLHFAETWFGTPESNFPAEDARVFNVFANGIALLRDYQVFRDAGGSNRSVVRTFDGLEPNAQGVLVLEFVPVKNYAEINAIEVVSED